jgi:hypothetical protein
MKGRKDSMSTQTDAPPMDSSPAVETPGATEASLLPRFVALLTPVFATLAGWVAHHTGLDLDSGEMTTFMVAAATAALASAWKWLHGWQQHELLVAKGLDAPRRRGADAPVVPAPDTVKPMP